MEQLFKELTFSNGVKAKNKFLLAPLTNMQSPDQGEFLMMSLFGLQKGQKEVLE